MWWRTTTKAAVHGPRVLVMDERKRRPSQGWIARGWPGSLFSTGRSRSVCLRGASSTRWSTTSGSVLSAHPAGRRAHVRGVCAGARASFEDNDRFTDLWANAGEARRRLGDHGVAAGPDAFAQFKLQENVSIPVIEERGRLLACSSVGEAQPDRRWAAGVRAPLRAGTESATRLPRAWLREPRCGRAAEPGVVPPVDGRCRYNFAEELRAWSTLQAHEPAGRGERAAG